MNNIPPFTVVIPARLHSTRLPNKPLLDLGGIPMVIRTALQAQKSQAQQVIIATDHAEVAALAQKYGISVQMTDPHHTTGTDRLSEVVRQLSFPAEHIVVNVQGDEPFIEPHFIHQVAAALALQPKASIATVACPIQEATTLFNPNCVKVVTDQENMALYFSRAPIPWARDFLQQNPNSLAPDLPCYLHIGLYAYTTEFLTAFPKLPKERLETWESLEQLRALENGYKIAVDIVPSAPQAGIDTPEDLAAARKYLQN